VTAVPRRDRHGNVIGFHGSIEDISEKKRLEQQVIRTQRMEALSALAGGIAHNFNNILVGIMGYSEYLLSKKEPDDRDYRALKTIHEGALRASELTRQLLSTTRGERHSPTKMNLNDVVEKVLPLVAGTFDTTIEIETHLARDLMLIEGDPGQWEQSLLNLCINARDAMPTGGRLVIETENKVLDEDFAKTHLGARVGSHVILSVTDTGVGIAPEIKDRIFEPFFTTKAKSGGTGMGLSTVWGIVKDHRGHITVYSEPGAGTTFRICIPALEGSMNAPESADEIEDSSGSETILLVDDEATVREIWGDFLREKGYRVITAENGKEGIDAFCRHRGEVDLIIVDFVMPGLGGEKTAQKIREIEPRAKVLFTSGYSKNGPIGEYLNGGTDPFIQKPVPLKELGNKVREILNKKGER
jgi:two-component system cell cycle sensor histidine kinase/response regulator CckA